MSKLSFTNNSNEDDLKILKVETTSKVLYNQDSFCPKEHSEEMSSVALLSPACFVIIIFPSGVHGLFLCNAEELSGKCSGNYQT